MEQCASVLLSFPPDQKLSDEQYHKAARQHVQALDRLIQERVILPYAERLLEVVSPSVNTISYLALLETVYSELKSTQVSDRLLGQTTTFLMVFDPRQVRYYGTTFSNLLALLGDGEVFPASVGVELLATALLRVDPSGSILTSHHVSLVNLAYQTGNIELVRKVIDKKILFYAGMKEKSDRRVTCDMTLLPTAYVTPELGLTTRLTPSMVLEYDIVCALCYLTQRLWRQAFEAFERVITFPTRDSGCSKLMVDAYGKWILTGLLLTGKTPAIPATASGSAQKAFSILGKPYVALAKAFEQPTAGQLQTELLSIGEQFLSEECNLGLVREVVQHYQKWQILGLRDVYTKVSLDKIRETTQDGQTAEPFETNDQVETLLRSMIDEGILRGVIVKPTGGKPAYLTFLPLEDPLTEAQFASEIRESAQRIKDLEPILKATNERLATHREYIRHMIKEKARADKSQHDMAIFEAQIEDEDLMTGIQTGI